MRTVSFLLVSLLATISILAAQATSEKKWEKDANPDCYCGLLMRGKNRTTISPWNMHVQTKDKSCLATIVASNLLLTSRQCISGSQSNGKSGLPEVEDLTVTNTVDQKDSPSFRVLGLILLEGIYSSWMVGLRVDQDFTSNEILPKPVCLVTPEEPGLQGNSLVGGNVTYQSGRGGPITNLPIKKGTDCFARGGQVKFLDLEATWKSEDILCLTLPPNASKMVNKDEVGQPIFLEVAKNPYAEYPHGYFTYLVGLSTHIWEGKDGQKHLFFGTLKSLKGSIGTTTQTKWCPQPWFWLNNVPNKNKRDQSLDCECGRAKEALEGRIIGGERAIPYEFPWMARFLIQRTGGPCGGAIINDRVVLTAAHCMAGEGQILLAGLGYNNILEEQTNDSFKLLLHSHKTENDSEAVQVRSSLVLVHPGYADSVRSFHNAEYDIALVILDEPLNFSAVDSQGELLYRPICLPKPGERKDVAGLDYVVAGWGSISANHTPIEVLSKLSLTFQPLHVCTDPYKPERFNTAICGGLTAFTKSPLNGDSGGPVFVPDEDGKHTQFGVVGYGNSKTDEAGNTVSAIFYQDLQEMLPWVDHYSSLHGGKYCRK